MRLVFRFMQNRVFYLDAAPRNLHEPPSSPPQAFTAANAVHLRVAQTQTFNIWHKRLGHLGAVNMRKLAQLTNIDLPPDISTICEPGYLTPPTISSAVTHYLQTPRTHCL